MDKIIAEYASVVDAIYGVYLDATRGFHLLRQEIERNQQYAVSSLPGTTIEQLDNVSMIYGVGHPNSPDAYTIHACTQSEFKRRNEEDGQNYKTIGNMCLVEIYQYWEDCYRQRVADQLGVATNDVTADIMGDLRFLRISIVHHRAVARADVAKCRLLKWFNEGDEVFLTKDQFEQLVFLVKTFLDTLTEKAI